MEGILWCKSPLCPTLLLYVQAVTVATVIPFGEKRDLMGQLRERVFLTMPLYPRYRIRI
jgi:hypothetical protein